MFTAIVVGTDDSPSARLATEKAAGLAKAFDATLHVVMAYRVGAVVAGGPDLAEGASLSAQQDTMAQMQNATDSALEGIVAGLVRQGVKTEAHAVAGDASEALLEVAEQARADLIVVGNRGMTGARRFLLGSVPNRVSHHATCDVLIVHTS